MSQGSRREVGRQQAGEECGLLITAQVQLPRPELSGFCNRERKPICLRLDVGDGDISCRIASNTILNRRSYLSSSSSSRRESSTFEASIWRSLTKALMISMLTETARLLRSTLESMATPCSVNAVTRLENFSLEDVTICDIPSISSLLAQT